MLQLKRLFYLGTGTFALTLFGCGEGSKSAKLTQAPSKAAEIHPGMLLGQGYDSSNPLARKDTCIEEVGAKTKASWKETAKQTVTLKDSRVTDTGALLNSIGVSAATAGNIEFRSDAAWFSPLEKLRADSAAFTWATTYVVETGEHTLDLANLRLTPRAESLKKDGAVFREVCGTDFIHSVGLGGKFIQVAEIDAKAVDVVAEQKMAQEIRKKDFSLAGVQSAYSFSDDKNLKANLGRNEPLSREVFQIGGQTDLGTPVATHLKPYLDKFRASINQANAIPVRAATYSYELFGVKDPDKEMAEKRIKSLDEYYRVLRRNRIKLNRISDLLTLASGQIYSLTDIEKEALHSKQDEILTQQKVIFTRGSDCIHSNSCAGAELPDIEFIEPALQGRAVQQDFLGLSYQILASVSQHSKDVTYKGAAERQMLSLYALSRNSQVDHMGLVFYEATCTSAENAAEEFFARLGEDQSKAKKIPSVAKIINAPMVDFQQAPNIFHREIFFGPNPKTGICTRMSVRLVGENVSLASELGDVSKSIQLVLDTAKYPD